MLHPTNSHAIASRWSRTGSGLALPGPTTSGLDVDAKLLRERIAPAIGHLAGMAPAAQSALLIRPFIAGKRSFGKIEGLKHALRPADPRSTPGGTAEAREVSDYVVKADLG